MIELEHIGAAQTVTGSKHLLRTGRANVLLDCGMFQGHRKEANALNEAPLPIDLAELDAVVLSHAHIDHSGALPILHRRGYLGPIYTTPATRDLCAPMLQDSAAIQEADARHIEKLIERGVDIEPAPALYRRQDAVGVLAQMTALPYRRALTIAPGVTLTFIDAGHVLGSAISLLDVEDDDGKARVVFTGDLGRPHLPILRDPVVAEGANVLLMESTYGDRLHGPIEGTADALADVVNRTAARGGKVVIPSFALERAQEIIFELKKLQLAGRIPKMPVYVDSPLTIKLTEVFRLHPDCYDEEAYALLQSGEQPFDLRGLEYVSEVARSKEIDAEAGPAIIVAASGMCEGGRILHHLRATVADEKNTVLIVGYQAQHTLGRRIVERRPEVRIFGVMVPLAAEVVVLDGFSAHADQAGLIHYAEAVRERGALEQIVLVHGDLPAQEVLRTKLNERGFSRVAIPKPGDRIRIRG